MPNGEEIKWPWMKAERKVGGFFPWQTPTGYGFELPWTKRMGAPWGTLGPWRGGEVRGDFTPDKYLRMLFNELRNAVAKGQMSEDDMNAVGRQAVDMLNRGIWGSSLPHMAQTAKDYVSWTKTQPEAEMGEEDLEELATLIGVSVQDLLRKQYGFPTSRELEEQEYERKIADWERKVEAQKGMWGDWQQQQQLEQYKRAALGQGIGRRFEAREAGQWQEQAQGANKERVWEATQREMIGQLDPDRDWMKIQELKGRRNPWATDPESATEERHWAEGELEKAESWAKTADAMLKAVKDPESYLTKEEMDYVYRAHAARDRALKRVAVATQKEQDWITEQGPYAGAGAGGTGMETATGITYGGGAPPRVEPQQPKTPAWMAKLYPEMGERMPEKGAGFTPLALSGQQWGGLSPSQQQRWMGTAKYYGEKPLDLLAQMRRMQPRTPPRPQRWSAARQMA